MITIGKSSLLVMATLVAVLVGRSVAGRLLAQLMDVQRLRRLLERLDPEATAYFVNCFRGCFISETKDRENMTSMDFSGERYVPAQGGAQIAYEHWHRYLFALRWAQGKVVLDVGTGTGYGAGLLSSVARRVWALDLDPETVSYARAKYNLSNLTFVQANAECLPLHTNSIDLIVAFEILEHLSEPESLVSEAARAVRPGGVVLISTPDKANYSDARCYSNPFHVREFYYDEFRALLDSHFRHVEIMHQRMRAGSMISAEVERSDEAAEIYTVALPECIGDPLTGMYFLAVCSDESISVGCPSNSVYLDPTDQLFQESDLKMNQSMAGYTKLRQKARRLASTKEALDGQITELRAEIFRHEQELLRLQQEFKDELDRRNKVIRDLQAQLDGRSRQPGSLANDVGQE